MNKKINIVEHKFIEIKGKKFITFPTIQKYFDLILSTNDNFCYDYNDDEKQKAVIDANLYFGECSKMISCKQTHSDNIQIVDGDVFFAKNYIQKDENEDSIKNISKKILCNETYLEKEKDKISIKNLFLKEYENSDALITKEECILIMKFADCTPILIYDIKQKILANIHSGWKGTAKKIGQKSLKIFLDKYNSNIKDIIVFIAPSISTEMFEVKQDLIDVFDASYGNISKYLKEKDYGHYIFDMKNLIIDEFIKMGIDEKNIFTTKLCTFKDNFLHSYRRDKEKSGRMYLFAKMRF